MKLDRLKRFWADSTSKAGGMGRRTLETLIPDEILQNSLFIGGFYDLARNIETLTEEGENDGSQRFLLKKGGGQVIDLATTPLTGLPITMWSALICDGCRVASWTMKTASESCESDEDLVLGRLMGKTAGEIDRVGELAEKVNRFFDTPGKEEAKALLEASAGLLEYTRENSEALGGEILSKVEDINRLTQQMAVKVGDPDLQTEFVAKTTGLIDDICDTTGSHGSDLKTFIRAPNKRNFVALSLGLERSFRKVPLFFYRETTLTLGKFPEYAKYLPRPDKEILAVARIIRGLSREAGGKAATYLEHYRKVLDR
jgi:hypothetical protein